MICEPPDACKALYVEDAREDQIILRNAIEFADVRVELVSASTARHALELLADTTRVFDILLVDWNLPGTGAVDFLTAVRRDQPVIPVIILTGEPGMVDVTATVRLGVAKIMKKPLLLEEWEELAKHIYSHCTVAAKATAP